MTTFQDPPPQSRRSARQTERGGAVDGGQNDGFSQQYPAQQYQGQPQDAQPPAGRRARAANAQNLYEVAPEPLTYTTQGAPYAAPQSPQTYAAPVAQGPDAAQYRVRDFSPDAARQSGRRASAPPLVEPPVGGYGAGDINYQTQGYGAAGTSAAAAPAAPTSRREQRQRQAEYEAATGQFAAQTTGQLPYNPTQLAQMQQQAPVQQQAPMQQQPPMQAAPPAPHAVAPQYPHAQAPTAYPAALPTQQPAPTALSNAMAEFEALTRNAQPSGPVAPQVQPVAPQQAPVAAPNQQAAGWVPPVGHWSRQADLDDETQPYANTITREVGGGNVATTTSALVLPEIPRADPFASVLTTTGEVLLTGSIDLPRSLGSTGGDARLYDDPGVDRMFDTQDAEYSGTDSAPVRAIRAVSTHSGSRGVIHANKPHGNRLITVVFVVTAILAVAVVGMLVASLSLHLF